MKHVTLWTALVSPLDENCNIDTNEMINLLERQFAHGNSAVLFGSTGEGALLSAKKKIAFLDALFGQMKQKAEYILLSTPNTSIDDAINFIAATKDYPIDGYMVTLPVYARPLAHAQVRWLEAIFNSSTKPVLVYENPGRIAATLSPEAVKIIAKHENFFGIKHSSDNIETFLAYQNAAPDLAMLGGDDYFFYELAQNGATGLISIAANVWPAEVKQLVFKSLSKTISQEERDILYKAGKLMVYAPNPLPCKALMHHYGMIKTNNLSFPLTIDDLDIKSFLLELESISFDKAAVAQ